MGALIPTASSQKWLFLNKNAQTPHQSGDSQHNQFPGKTQNRGLAEEYQDVRESGKKAVDKFPSSKLLEPPKTIFHPVT
jgi:hypothetical protein